MIFCPFRVPQPKSVIRPTFTFYSAFFRSVYGISASLLAFWPHHCLAVASYFGTLVETMYADLFSPKTSNYGKKHLSLHLKTIKYTHDEKTLINCSHGSSAFF